MKKITQLLFLALTITFFASCEESTSTDPTGVNYVTFEAATYTFGVDIGSTNTNDIKVYAANISGSERTINVSVVAAGTSADPASYTVPTTVTIPANSNVGTLSITVSDINVSATGETIELAFGAQPGLFTGENMVLDVRQVCPTNEVTLKLGFDNWPEEVSYDLSMGGTSVESTSTGDFASEPDGSEWTKPWCLADGMYTFTINDSYGDGGTNVTITTASGQYTIGAASFTTTASVNFTLP
ncbi:MAG: hypothetical protein JXQ93_06715 [Flavobacteriaceae bacterium]